MSSDRGSQKPQLPPGPVNLHKSLKTGATLKEAVSKATTASESPKKR